MTDVADKVRNAIKDYVSAVSALVEANKAVKSVEVVAAAATREVDRQIQNNYPSKSILHGGRRYSLKQLRDGYALEVVDSNEIVLD